jgi:hypothetical protein
MALPVLDAAIHQAIQALGTDPVAASVRDVVSAELEFDEPIRAVDALLVVKQLEAAIGPEPARVYSAAGVNQAPSWLRGRR